jgi:acyl-coenzyme A thioesterase 13
MADFAELARARDALAVNPDHHAQVEVLSAAASASLSSSSEHLSPSFFEGFALRGIRVLRIHPGFIHCSYTVPPGLTVRLSRPSFDPSFTPIHRSCCNTNNCIRTQDSTTGCLAAGAVVALVDEVGSAASVSDAKNIKVSVDMSVAFADLSQARPGDNLSITARALGHKGAYTGTHVLFTNADTGSVVAEGRHSLFGNMKKSTPEPATAHRSKM